MITYCIYRGNEVISLGQLPISYLTTRDSIGDLMGRWIHQIGKIESVDYILFDFDNSVLEIYIK